MYVFNIDNQNVSQAANHHIGVISEGSGDTEYWSNDALITGINYILQYIRIQYSYSIEIEIIFSCIMFY